VAIRLQVVEEAAGLPGVDELDAWLSQVFQVTATTAADLTLRVVGEAESRELNARFRHKDKSTNVLSFPSVNLPGLPARTKTTLGDLVVCAPVVEREAAGQGKAIRAHWAHMLVHGTLHLLGYDHVGAAEAERMEALERRILANCGFADPYAENGA
jgi:probable rRNA maturation factor